MRCAWQWIADQARNDGWARQKANAIVTPHATLLASTKNKAAGLRFIGSREAPFSASF